MNIVMQQLINQITPVPSNFKMVVMDDDNIFSKIKFTENLFNSENFQDVKNTAHFIMKKYGKGIYVKIINNRIDCFIPFKNPDYKDTILDIFVLKNYNLDENVLWIRDFIAMLCENRSVSDCEFFINSELKTPLARVDGNSSFKNLTTKTTKNCSTPLKLHTILSFNSSSEYRDILFPEFTDFQRIIKNKFGIENFRNMKWEDKVTEFLYRGDVINEGVYTDSYPFNQKLSIIKFMKENYPQIENCGITEFYENTPVIIQNKTYFFEKNEFFKNNKEIEILSKSKFIFAIDGLGHPEELSMLLFSGSCILRVESEWDSWYDSLLEDGFHYISIKSNLSDLKKKIEWCLSNDEKCKQIGLNARDFATKYLSKNAVLDYMQLVLNTCIQRIDYNVSLSIIQAENQRMFIENHFNLYDNLPEMKVNVNVFKKYSRNWEWNTALSMMIYKNFSEMNTFSDFYEIVNYKDNLDGMNAAFVGINTINDLTREIPNFCFTYFAYTADNVVVLKEKLTNAVPLNDFLISNNDKFTEIFIQIFLALQLAYERFCFEHRNLSPNNVVIQTLDKPVKITYILENKIWAINTKYIAIICDYSKSQILSDFSNKKYKIKRMFIGRNEDMDNIFQKDDNIKDKVEKLLHTSGTRDSKYLLKKIGKKILNKIKNDSHDPESIMRDVVKRKDILENKIKFGMIDEEKEIEDEKPQSPRLIYDKINLNEKNPHQKIVDRIFQGGLPAEKTSVGNSILQYEILQNLKSSLGDMHFKVTFDINTSDKIIQCINFVKEKYSDLINETFSDIILADLEDSYNLKMFLRKNIRAIFKNKLSKRMFSNITMAVLKTLRDAILIGVKNTKNFYIK